MHIYSFIYIYIHIHRHSGSKQPHSTILLRRTQCSRSCNRCVDYQKLLPDNF